MKKIFIVCFIITFSVGCNQQKQPPKTFKGQNVNIVSDSVKRLARTVQNLKTIDLSELCNDKFADFLPLLDEYRLVKLEATDDCLIGEIRKVVLADTLIFVNDAFIANKLFLFNDKGKFIRQIGRKGQGPGEYVQVSDFYYDETTGEILLYDQFRSRIMYFDLAGKHLRDKKQIISYINFTKIDDEYVYKTLDNNEHIPAVDESYITVGSDSVPVKYVCLPELKIKFGSDNLHKINDTTATFCIPFYDTIYHYSRGVLSAEYFIKLPKGKRLPSNFQAISSYDYEKFRNEFPNSEYMYYKGHFLENDDYFQCSIYISKKGEYIFLYNKETGEITGGVNGWSSDDGFEKWLLYNRFISSSGKYFISAVQPDILVKYVQHYKKPDKSEILAKHPELLTLIADDNPLLFIFKLKK
jgi:hypothetical protein